MSAAANQSSEMPPGLSTEEAKRRTKQFGPNIVAEEKTHPAREFVRRFWSPVPWLLEATIIIQLFLGEAIEAAVIAGLLIFNAILSFLQEERTQKVLMLLRRQLQVRAKVRRDGAWVTISAEELVPGDWAHLAQGEIVPADVRIENGLIFADQSMLTGESSAVAIERGGVAYAGSVVQSGGAAGEVIGTAADTFFGKTAELVQTARSVNRQEHEVTAVVRNLFVVNAAMIVVVLGYAYHSGISLGHMLPLVLALLLASIPVALPATFTLTAAIGSVRLSRHGVLITRLSALHDIASMSVLCTDKTGTLTRNQATVQTLWAAPGCGEGELLRAATTASDPSGQDPVDAAILVAAQQRGCAFSEVSRIEFKPFDPAVKWAEGTSRSARGLCHAIKGAPAAIAKFDGISRPVWQTQTDAIARTGERVIAVASNEDGEHWRFLGLIGLADELRENSAAVISAIQEAGVRVVMVTGDNALTAAHVAGLVGIPPSICPLEDLRGTLSGEALKHSVFARILPQEKFRIIRAFQRLGQVVAMVGDGVNDAPALRQAEAGIAVASATDVAKAAAAIVLTRPGLGDVVPAIRESRQVFQQIITYTLNMLAKKIELMALLAAGFLLTGHKPMTPLMMVLVLFLNDFLTMSLSADHMSISNTPTRWNTRAILIAASIIGGCKLFFSLGVFVYGDYVLHFDTPHLQTLAFTTVIFSTQAGIYLLRERGHFWASRPAFPLIASSAFGILAAVILSQSDLIMPSLRLGLLVTIAGACLLYFTILDFLKIRIFGWLRFR